MSDTVELPGYRNVNAEFKATLTERPDWLTPLMAPGTKFIAVPTGTSPEYTHCQMFEVLDFSDNSHAIKCLQYRKGYDTLTDVVWLKVDTFCKYWDLVDTI